MRTLLFPLGSVALALALLGASSSSAPFSDVSPSTPHAEAIMNLQKRSVVNGYADGTFRSTALVNRAEFLKMLMAAQETMLAMADYDIHCFTDFTGSEQWFWYTACMAKEQGIVEGNPDGSFRGTMPVNMAEALAMSVRAWKIPEPQFFRAPDHWYDTFMIATSSHTHFFDDMPQEPNRHLTRADAAAVIDAFLSANLPMCGTHSAGESYPSGDGCNTCSCTANGEICSKRACVQKTCSSTSQCGIDEVCTTEDGACQKPPCPADTPNCIVPAVCMGVCRMK